MAKREKKTAAKTEESKQTEIKQAEIKVHPISSNQGSTRVSDDKIDKHVDVSKFFEKFSELAKKYGFDCVNEGWNGAGHVEFWMERGGFPKVLSFLSDVIAISDGVRVSFSGDAYCGNMIGELRLKVVVPAPLTVIKVG